MESKALALFWAACGLGCLLAAVMASQGLRTSNSFSYEGPGLHVVQGAVYIFNHNTKKQKNKEGTHKHMRKHKTKHTTRHTE